MDNKFQDDPEQMLALLKWYRAAGVDIGMSDTPIDRFAEPRQALFSASSAPNIKAPVVSSSSKKSSGLAVIDGPSPPVVPTSQADPAEAQALAQSADNLEQLRTHLEAYQGCGLKLRATQLVFADGNPDAEIMLVGEAPGRDEDLQGKPFVGRSGQLLDHMLASIGLDRSLVYIANTVPWRPPGNRTPSPLEIGLCLPFLHRQVELVAPKILITLGAAATQTVFDAKLSILKVRGKWRDVSVGRHQVRALPTLHPAFLLRQPAQKRHSWSDMLEIAKAMDEMGIKSGNEIHSH